MTDSAFSYLISLTSSCKIPPKNYINKACVIKYWKKQMKTKRQYLIVDTKRYRRHSAPENLGLWFGPPEGSQAWVQRDDWCRASVSDFSVLLENQSESGSSQELDTSNLSRDLSPIPTTKTTPRDSYQNIPLSEIEVDKDDYCRSFGSWVMWKNIILSQAIAGCMAIMDASNTNLKNNSRNLVSNGQNLPHYILLGVIWTTKLALRNDGRDIVQVIRYSGLRYLFLSILHVEANYLLLSSFRHNTYLGNQMIDCIAACLSVVIAYVCLEVQFHFLHATGLAFAAFGAVGFLLANIIYKNHNHDDIILGDVLRVTTGICLAFNSIAQEIIIKSIDFVEYMGMIGLLGSVICGFQAVLLETNKIFLQTSGYWMNMASYSLAQFAANSLIPKVLHEMGAPGLHLALTTFEFYSYFIELISYREKMHMLYLTSYGIILGGVIVFFSKKTIIGTETFFPVKITMPKDS